MVVLVELRWGGQERVKSKQRKTNEKNDKQGVASFKRHQQHKDVPYDEGCGGIMWDAEGYKYDRVET